MEGDPAGWLLGCSAPWNCHSIALTVLKQVTFGTNKNAERGKEGLMKSQSV